MLENSPVGFREDEVAGDGHGETCSGVKEGGTEAPVPLIRVQHIRDEVVEPNAVDDGEAGAEPCRVRAKSR